MVSIFENLVVEWVMSDSDKYYLERILWISSANDVVFSIAMEDEKAFPVMKTYKEYVAGFESNLCKTVEWVNENISLLDHSISEEHLRIRDKSWDAIKEIVLDEPECFYKNFRGVRVQEAQERTGLHKSTIYRYLRRYWQGGKMKNALLPHYNNCGRYGEERAPGEIKRGR